MQLCHIGHQISLADRKESLGSPTMFEMQGGIRPFPIRGVTIAEINQIIDDFAKAAWRAKMAGFDGIEIHGAIGHLINMFCSPQYNHRTDKYGGSPENRIRFMVEIIEACQKSCGKDFPIILDGGFTTPEFAEEILEAGYADFIGIGRPALADPAWIKKIKAGKREDIIPCMRCTMGFVGTIEGFNAAIGLRCSVNPLCNTSNFRKVEPAKEKKRVCVVGGGPAGMEAARVAAVRGHEVTLYEKRKLGGSMHEDGFSEDLKSDIRILIDYYAGQMKRNGIRVIEEEATVEKILAGNYDAVVVAAGAKPVVTKYEKQDELQVHSIYDYCRDHESFDLGERVVIAGGCFMNLEVAQSLLRAGKQVTVASRRGGGMMGVMEIGDDNSSPQQQRLMILNAEKGIPDQDRK